MRASPRSPVLNDSHASSTRSHPLLTSSHTPTDRPHTLRKKSDGTTYGTHMHDLHVVQHLHSLVSCESISNQTHGTRPFAFIGSTWARCFSIQPIQGVQHSTCREPESRGASLVSHHRWESILEWSTTWVANRTEPHSSTTANARLDPVCPKLAEH